MIESSAAATTERQKEDKEFFLKLLKDILKVEYDDKDIKRFFCIGKIVEKKDRSCLIEFRDGSVKNAVMESLSKLANAEDKYKKLSIAHYVTKLERVELKKLLAEAKDKESNEGQGE